MWYFHGLCFMFIGAARCRGGDWAEHKTRSHENKNLAKDALATNGENHMKVRLSW